jgi:hypothetical protein
MLSVYTQFIDYLGIQARKIQEEYTHTVLKLGRLYRMAVFKNKIYQMHSASTAREEKDTQKMRNSSRRYFQRKHASKLA